MPVGAAGWRPPSSARAPTGGSPSEASSTSCTRLRRGAAGSRVAGGAVAADEEGGAHVCLERLAVERGLEPQAVFEGGMERTNSEPNEQRSGKSEQK